MLSFKMIVTNVFLSFIGLSSLLLFMMYDIYPVKSLLADVVIFSSTLYFLKDLVLMILFFDRKHIIYFPHHISAFISCASVWWYPSYNMLIVGYLSFEISTPVLNYAKHLHKIQPTSKKYEMTMAVFVILFIFVRICLGTYLTFISVMVLPSHIAILPLILQFLNYYWFYKIIIIIKNKL